MRPEDTASDPARQGIPGATSLGPLGAAVGSLSQSFQAGLQGPGAMLGGGAEGAEAAGGLAELAPLMAL